MSDFDRKVDWQINNNIKVELVKRWIDVQKLRIMCTKGNVEIKGELEFTGKLAAERDPTTVINFLKTLDLVLKGLPNVKSIKWDLHGWNKVGAKWVPGQGNTGPEKK